MLLHWTSRCLPGFSIVGLAFLLLLTFTGISSSPWWEKMHLRPSGAAQNKLKDPFSLVQQAFVIYTMLVHLNMLGFTLRLGCSLFWITKKTQQTIKYRHGGNETELNVRKSLEEKGSENSTQELTFAIILPNFGEDYDVLRTTIQVLASHPRAQSQYEVYLAMEQKENGSPEKAQKLAYAFENSFHRFRTTFHPAGIPGEIAGKSSNVAFAAHQIIDFHRPTLRENNCNVIITVMDADTHLSQDYFTEIQRLHSLHLNEANRSLYCCPIIFDRNSHETPIFVRCADLLWGFAGISTMYPGSRMAIPTSVYSLPLSLAEQVGGWDSDPIAIGEDMHMLLKCYFETAGDLVCRVIYVPASQCNVSSDTERGWPRVLDTSVARYRQALRHMWGALDSGFAVRQTLRNFRFNRRCLLLRPRLFALLHLLWEAHFLPCHLAILMIFSVFYTLWTPAMGLHPSLSWVFSVTNVLRTLSFMGMNICLFLYDHWHSICIDARMRDMRDAQISGTGCSRRIWFHPQYLLERLCFPISGTLFGAIPTLHAVFSHFWTDRLLYRVSKKPKLHGKANTTA